MPNKRQRSWLDDRELEEENGIPVSIMRGSICREHFPDGCPHVQEYECFRIRGRMYKVFRPACADRWVGSWNARIKDYANHVEYIFGISLFREREIFQILDHHYPAFFKKFKGPGQLPEPVSYYASSSYHSSWTNYWSIRDVVRLLNPRPKCIICGKKPHLWDTIPYHTNSDYKLQIGSSLLCSIDCYEKHLRVGHLRYLRHKRQQMQERQERRDIKNARKQLREVKKYLRENPGETRHA